MDNKMKDSDIIKALECCKSAIATDCKDCPLYNTAKNSTCVTVLSENALDLINRQKEEIKRLHTMNSEQRIGAKVLKRTAITEFARRLSDIICDNIERSDNSIDGVFYNITDVYTDIDNLVKDMVGE